MVTCTYLFASSSKVWEVRPWSPLLPRTLARGSEWGSTPMMYVRTYVRVRHDNNTWYMYVACR